MNDTPNQAGHPATSRNFFQTSRGRYTIGLVALLVILGLGLIFIPRGGNAQWQRPDYPSVAKRVQYGATLYSISAEHKTAPVTLALFNNQALAKKFPETCADAFYRTWPTGKYYCNRKLNLAPASTLTPNQQLRIPVTSSLPTPIQDTLAVVGKEGRVVVLIDASSKAAQRNFDYAAPIAFGLQKSNQLAGVWVFTGDRVFEYIDAGRAFKLDTRDRSAANRALLAVSQLMTDKIVLVSDQELAAGTVADSKPVIGFCTASACEKAMKKISKSSGGRYVPYGDEV